VRRGVRASALLGVFIATTCAFSANAGALTKPADSAGKTIQINTDFSWKGTRNCESQRPGSVICISAQADVEGLGLVEYARDAVPNGETTPDGCPEYSTQGTLWVPGGTAKFDGTPVPTCGATDNPDAHYSYTIHDGTGVLAGATGTGDVVADNGVDRWHGTLQLAAKPAPTAAASSAAAAPVANKPGHTSSSALPLIAGIGGAVVVAALAGTLFYRRRRPNAEVQPLNTTN